MREGYEAPDIDTTMAQRQAAGTQEAFVQFQSVRSLPGSASAAFSFGTHASRPSSGAVGDGYFETDRNWLYYNSGTAWKYEAGVNVGTDAVRAAITVSANDNGALFFTTDTGAWWRVEGGAWANKSVTISATTAFKVGTTQVVGSQGAAVVDAAGGAVIDVEARAAINALLARVRAHGLIA